MYFNKDNNFFHGIMFHHFHDGDFHIKSQGSIDKDDFYKMINFIGKKNILSADIFFEKFKNNKLKDNEVCLTFDDAIKCQTDIALPILEELKIKGFFFVYTSIFENDLDLLEVFRYFRTNYFNNIDEFYSNFYKILDKDLKKFFEINNNKIRILNERHLYNSIEDTKFRFVRDFFLTKDQYKETMLSMFHEKKFNYQDILKRIFFNNNDLKTLYNLGHSIGLHGHNHNTQMERLNYDEQKKEYEKCISVISKIIDKPKNEIKCMSHPCGSYNDDTLKVLKEMGIELGFKQIMTIETEKKMKKINNSFLEIARQDHAHVRRMIYK